MPNLKETLERINSVKSMKQVVQTMKFISISKFTKSKSDLYNVKMYEKYLKSMFSSCSYKNLNQNDYALKNNIENSKSKILLIPISSNIGFCGSFNNNIYKKTFDFLSCNNLANVVIMPIGKKIGLFLKRNGYKFVGDFINILYNFNFNDIYNFSERIVEDYLGGNYADVYFIYNDFTNNSTYCIKISDIKNVNVFDVDEKEIIFEPDKTFFNKVLEKKVLEAQIIKIFLETSSAENNTRMINMNKASDNADASIKNLQIIYDKDRQAIITNEIIEIMNGSVH